MAKFKVASSGQPANTVTVAGLVDKLVAFWPLAEGRYETKLGVKAGFRVDVAEIETERGQLMNVTRLGEIVIFQEVLLEKIREHGPGSENGWLVGRLIRPGKAYLIDPPDDDELPLIEQAVDVLDEPDSDGGPFAGSGPDDPDF